MIGGGGAKVALVGWGIRVETSADGALVELFREHSGWLVGMLTMLVGDRAAAEDLAQEAFLRTYRAWPRIEDHERAVGYLRTTAMNLARSGFRRRAVALRYREPASVAPLDAADAVVLQEEHQAVVDAVRTLPTRQRECVVLRYYCDATEHEIAATLGISNNSVKTHLRRAMQALETRLDGT